MKITKQYLKELIKEAMEEVPAVKPKVDHRIVSMDKVERLQEMKAEIDEMVDMVGPDVDETAKMSLLELAREFETTIAALEIR